VLSGTDEVNPVLGGAALRLPGEAWRSLPGSGKRRLALQPEQAAHVVDEVGEADLGYRPRQAEGAHEQAHPVLLLGKDVLDMSPDDGLRRVRLGRADRHRATLWLLAMNVAHEHALAQKVLVFPRTIGRISPDAAGRVRAIEQIGQARAGMRRGVGHQPLADQPVTAIVADVALVAELGDRQIDYRRLALAARLGVGRLDGPARSAVLLAKLGRL
jgi:hypothetical protein